MSWNSLAPQFLSVTTSNRAGIQRVEAVLFHLLNLGQTQGRGSWEIPT